MKKRTQETAQQCHSQQLGFAQGANSQDKGVCTEYMTHDQQACNAAENTSAQRIYQEAIIIDGHFAIELAMPGTLEEKWALIDCYAAAGVTSICLSLANDENKLEETLGYLALIRRHIFSHSDKFILAKTKEDILRAKKENKLAIRLMFQGAAAPLAMNINFAELYSQLGISSLIIAYNIRTYMGDGCIEEVDGGISHLGKRLIQEMNKLGIIIDGAHCSMKTIMDSIATSKLPVIISHACAYGINPIPRNIKDEQIKAIAQSGGVIGINGIGLLLGDKSALIKKYLCTVRFLKKSLRGVKRRSNPVALMQRIFT